MTAKKGGKKISKKELNHKLEKDFFKHNMRKDLVLIFCFALFLFLLTITPIQNASMTGHVTEDYSQFIQDLITEQDVTKKIIEVEKRLTILKYNYNEINDFMKKNGEKNSLKKYASNILDEYTNLYDLNEDMKMMQTKDLNDNSVQQAYQKIFYDLEGGAGVRGILGSSDSSIIAAEAEMSKSSSPSSSVGATESQSVAGAFFAKLWDNIMSFEFSSLLDNDDEFSGDVAVARYMYFFLALMFFWGMLNMMAPNFNFFLKVPTAFVLSYLFIGFIVQGDLLAVLTIYSAAGIALLAVLPMLILIFFSVSMIYNERVPEIGAILMERFVWLFFLIFLVWKVIELLFFTGASNVSTGTLVVLVVVILVTFLITIFHGFYLNRASKFVQVTEHAIFKFAPSKSRTARLKQISSHRKEVQDELDKIMGRKIKGESRAGDQDLEDNLKAILNKLDDDEKELHMKRA